KALPSAYDNRLIGRAPKVKNQGDLGTCWAFASLTAIESALLPEEAFDFSEDHMSISNSFHLKQDDGGEYSMAMAYLLAWQGPVLEQDDPYGDGSSPAGLSPVKHVQEIQILPSKDYDKIKEGVILYGGVQSSLYTALQKDAYQSYCYTGTEEANHDVVIVGWDDDYPREKFAVPPEKNGAFLCVSSWGEGFGDGGYFYVSYEDRNLGIYNVVYTGIDSTDRYEHIYQSDLCGWIGQMGYGHESAYGANVYRSDSAQSLLAAGFYATDIHTTYEIYVIDNLKANTDIQTAFSKRKVLACGSLDQAGYYTIELDHPVALKKGERFAVMVKLTTPGTVHPLAIEYQSDQNPGRVEIGDGEGYISYRGTDWESTEEKYHSNLCLKAYTVDR
ncbi:MAG: lectin like domain-containing protein, partial [Hungatella sp.]